MLLILVAVAAGLVAGRLLRPLPRHLGRPYVRWLPVLVAGGAVDLIATRIDGGLAAVILFLGTALLAAFAMANVHLTGMGVLMLGLGCNLLAVAANRGMPVRADAVVAAGIADRFELPALDLRGGRHLERSNDPLPWLGDVVPIALGRVVVSFGDLIVAVGAADVVAHLSRRRSDEPATTPA